MKRISRGANGVQCHADARFLRKKYQQIAHSSAMADGYFSNSLNLLSRKNPFNFLPLIADEIGLKRKKKHARPLGSNTGLEPIAAIHSHLQTHLPNAPPWGGRLALSLPED